VHTCCVDVGMGMLLCLFAAQCLLLYHDHIHLLCGTLFSLCSTAHTMTFLCLGCTSWVVVMLLSCGRIVLFIDMYTVYTEQSDEQLMYAELTAVHLFVVFFL